MGCCCSFESEVPENILPDPAVGDQANFYTKKVGAFSKDVEVYKDEERKEKWLLVNQEGGLFDGELKVTVENYVRTGEGKSGDGECLCHAVMDKLDSDNYKYYDGEIEVDTDDSDFSADSDEGEEDVDGVKITVKTKWACKTTVKFYEDRACTKKLAELKVKAKGKAKKKTTKVETEVRPTQLISIRNWAGIAQDCYNLIQFRWFSLCCPSCM